MNPSISTAGAALQETVRLHISKVATDSEETLGHMGLEQMPRTIRVVDNEGSTYINQSTFIKMIPRRFQTELKLTMAGHPSQVSVRADLPTGRTWAKVSSIIPFYCLVCRDSSIGLLQSPKLHPPTNHQLAIF